MNSLEKSLTVIKTVGDADIPLLVKLGSAVHSSIVGPFSFIPEVLGINEPDS